MTGAVDKRDVSHQEKLLLANRALKIILLLRSVRVETLGSWAPKTFIKLGISITQLNCDVSDLLFLVFNSIYS